MSNIILNFSSSSETYQFRINTGLSHRIQHSEEEFSRVLREVEARSMPIYKAIVDSILAHARGDLPSCLSHTRRIGEGLRPVLSAYYDRVHDKTIARDAWLSRVQGFYAWGMGVEDARTGKWIKFDGLSGNQVMLFQAVDAFLGLEVYLSEETRHGNVPRLQREFCDAVARASFRGLLGDEGVEGKIQGEMGEIVKRMRVSTSRLILPERVQGTRLTAGRCLDRRIDRGRRNICWCRHRRGFP